MKLKCPICGGELERKCVPYIEVDTGFSLGEGIEFEADVCTECGEIFFTEEASKKLDLIFMDVGAWNPLLLKEKVE